MIEDPRKEPFDDSLSDFEINRRIELLTLDEIKNGYEHCISCGTCHDCELNLLCEDSSFMAKIGLKAIAILERPIEEVERLYDALKAKSEKTIEKMRYEHEILQDKYSELSLKYDDLFKNRDAALADNARLTAEIERLKPGNVTIEWVIPQKILDDIKQVKADLKQVTAERDELKRSAWQECDGDAVCAICRVDRLSFACKSCFMGRNYKWRGIKEDKP